MLRNLGNEHDQREIRSRIVADFFVGLALPEKPPPFTDDERVRLVSLAVLVARCRSPVVRDRYKGDNVVLVPEAESPGRLAGALSQVAAGMRAVGAPENELWRLTLAKPPSAAFIRSVGAILTTSNRVPHRRPRPSPRDAELRSRPCGGISRT